LKTETVEKLIVVQSSLILEEKLLDNDPIRVIQSWADVDLIANKDAVLENSSLITAVEFKNFIEPWEHQAIHNEVLANEKKTSEEVQWNLLP
jgi:predicted acyl esterase